MTGTAPAAEAIRNPASLARRFEAIVFDWEAAAVPDRRANAAPVRRLVEQAVAHGLELAIVSDAEVGSIERQLGACPAGPGGLVLALNHGSEGFSVDLEGPMLAFRRTATAAEDAALTRAAELTVKRLRSRGLRARVVSEGLDRRKIDLTPVADGVGHREIMRIGRDSAVEAGLADPRVRSDSKCVEIGLTDASDSARWITHWLWERGIAPDQVLIVGDEFGPRDGLPGSDSLLLIDELEDATAVSVGIEPDGVPAGVVWLGGGPDVFAALLEDQVTRRRRGELPVLCETPGWVVAVEGADPLLERVRESLLTLADGRLGTRGGVVVRDIREDSTVLMSGVYTRTGAEAHLLAGPRWNVIAVKDPAARPLRRVLDLRTGVVRQHLVSSSGPLDVLMFSSLARPGTAVLRAQGRVETERRAGALEPPPELAYERGTEDGCVWMSIRGRPGSIAAAAYDQRQGPRSSEMLDRVAAYDGVVQGAADRDAAVGRVRHAREVGFDGLLCEHRRRWASRWANSDVTIDGDPGLQRAVRFALFHLMASVGEEGEAAVGARGLSGGAYRGHVFWDSDVYVLPFLAATHPPAARAMLEYRIRRLPAAIRIAHAQRRAGARFPWESAWSGRDVTPDRARAPHGETVPILTGELEEHIVADVAWAAACYIDWTGDQAFARGAGCELLVQTARWWASRIEQDEQGRGHIRGVIGPDEYHAPVDDNAFTNVMARWNLRRAAEVSAEAVGEDERRRWRELAETVVDGYDPQTRLYEQFAGFHDLEPLLIADVAPQRPVAADVLLGHERIRSAQVIKQADVLMLHYLVGDEVASGSLEPNLEFYEPRTAHGSTLSPGVHAALLARAGRLQAALEMLRLAARIDLDDIGHLTAGGLHLAAMGSVWRALAFGFAGLRPVGDALAIDPVIAPGWETLELRVRFRGSRVVARVHPGMVEASADPPVNALRPDGERVELACAAQTFKIRPTRSRSDR
jgi:trehalose/maltose hydrolase-like predicted phosphorylase